MIIVVPSSENHFGDCCWVCRLKYDPSGEGDWKKTLFPFLGERKFLIDALPSWLIKGKQ